MNRLSLKKNYWQQLNVDENFIQQIRQHYSCSDLLATLLSFKINSVDEIDAFLHPKIKKYLKHPFVLKDLQKGAERFVQAILKNERIYLFADYDVDGATSCAILIKLLNVFGATNYKIYIPDRLKEGYGLSIKALKIIAADKCNLLITLDCGAGSQKEVDYAKACGIEVIVIDHHIVDFILKNVFALINPNRIDESVGFENLAAVGVSYLFAIATFNVASVHKSLKKKVTQYNLLYLLDLVALGTVCDVVPLTGLNRAFVSQGLKILSKRTNIGLKALVDISQITSVLNAYHLGFLLGPRINAASRIGDCTLPVKMLSTQDSGVAQKIATKLDEYNAHRQIIEKKMLDDAINMVEDGMQDADIIIVGSESWSVGIIGIIASRLKDIFAKPAIVLSWSNDIAKASCRSVNGIDLGAKILLARLNNLIIEGGGHKMAAGFSIYRHQLNNFKSFISQSIKKDLNNNPPNNTQNYVFNIPADAINADLVREIELIGPFGTANQEPVFKIEHVKLRYVALRGTSHIAFHVKSINSFSNASIKMIAYNAVNTDIGNFLLSNPKHSFAVFCKLKINYWNGKEIVESILKDIVI